MRAEWAEDDAERAIGYAYGSRLLRRPSTRFSTPSSARREAEETAAVALALGSRTAEDRRPRVGRSERYGEGPDCTRRGPRHGPQGPPRHADDGSVGLAARREGSAGATWRFAR